MGDELFREGGPHNIKRKRDGKYEMSVGIPKGSDDMTARQCPEASCLPGYFRVKGGMDTAEDGFARTVAATATSVTFIRRTS